MLRSLVSGPAFLQYRQENWAAGGLNINHCLRSVSDEFDLLRAGANFQALQDSLDFLLFFLSRKKAGTTISESMVQSNSDIFGKIRNPEFSA